MAALDWNGPDRDELLIAAVAQGQTFETISRSFGVSRSAIAGKVRRLKLAATAPVTPKPSRAPAPQRPTAALSRTPAIAQPVEPFAVVLANDTPTGRPWVTRGPHECAWPIQVGSETFSCCARAEGAYCAEHAKIAYRGHVTAAELAREIRRHM